MKTTLDTWHQYVNTQDPKILDELLADDVVFYSPVVFSPQKGKFLTSLYLLAAGKVLFTDFRYVKEIVNEHNCMLEFECTIDGKYINGVDIISVNDQGEITEFKVMVRPLKAMNAIHAEMGKMLDQMNK